uniref:Putative secreted protein n=1 Tax=Anopheles marajoara TaxID=58244 RepID=A0A2M4CEV7_9DIPT
MVRKCLLGLSFDSFFFAGLCNGLRPTKCEGLRMCRGASPLVDVSRAEVIAIASRKRLPSSAVRLVRLRR